MVQDVAVVGVYLQEQHTEAPRAYVVPSADVEPSAKLEGEIHQWLNGRIVHYKRLRGGIRFIDAVPKSAAGKILRKVLKEQAAGENGPRVRAKL